MTLTSEDHVFFVGAGAMSEAMIKGWLSAHLLSAEQIIISNRHHYTRLEELADRYGVQVCRQRAVDIARASVVIFAVKPFDQAAALQEVAPFLASSQLIISVAAGVSTSIIERTLDRSIPVIRAMPNTSSAVQASATALCAGRWATARHMEIAHHLFSGIGISLTVHEEQMDAVTGLSGTGPAYFYYVVETLLEAGQRCGLSEETTRSLLIQTLYGSAKMLQETGLAPDELRRQVTSPNGTTMAAMNVLEESGARQSFLRAVQSATRRATEMGKLVEDL
jgi:pyrroline-5-carboxylate reductase